MRASRTGWSIGVATLLAVAAGALPPLAARPREVRARIIPVAGKALTGVEWSPDGGRLACFGQDNTLVILDAASGRRIQSRRFKVPVRQVRWRPDWKRLAVRREDGRVEIREPSRWRVVRTLPGRRPHGWPDVEEIA